MTPRTGLVASIGVLVLAVVVVAAILVQDAGSDRSVHPSRPSGAETVATGSTVDDPGPEPVPTDAVLGRDLAAGSMGPGVEMLQQRLIDLGLDPGPIDGVFGPQTLHAVWSFEKLAMEVPRDELRGWVTVEMWNHMKQPIQLVPRRTGSPGIRHVEVYLPEQLLVVFDGDEPVLMTHISSGDDHEWCDRVVHGTDLAGEHLAGPVESEVCGVSSTPGGVFEIERKAEGEWRTPLGSLQSPLFFNGPIAIHGADIVPASPLSRSDVRVPIQLTEALHDQVTVGDRVYVFDGEHDPEDVPPEQMRPEVSVREADGADTIPGDRPSDGGANDTTT